MLRDLLPRERFSVMRVHVGHRLAHKALRLAAQLALARQRGVEVRQRLFQAEDALAQHARHAQVQAGHLRLGQRLARHHNDRNVACRRPLAHRLQHRETIHFRHYQVQQHQVHPFALKNRQRFESVVRLEHPMGGRTRLHDARVHLQRLWIVVYHQERRLGVSHIGGQPALIERARQLGQLDGLGEIVELQQRPAVLCERVEEHRDGLRGRIRLEHLEHVPGLIRSQGDVRHHRSRGCGHQLSLPAHGLIYARHLHDEPALLQVQAQAFVHIQSAGEHQHPGRHFGHGYRCPLLRGRRRHRRQGEGEGRAGPFLAGRMYLDRAAVQLDETPADRQPQPQAAIAAGDAPLRPPEIVEDRALFLRRDAQPRVAHADSDRLRAGLHRQTDLAARRKLDRIADQVERHLRQPRAVAPNPRPRLRQVCAPGQPFVRSQPATGLRGGL